MYPVARVSALWSASVCCDCRYQLCAEVLSETKDIGSNDGFVQYARFRTTPEVRELDALAHEFHDVRHPKNTMSINDRNLGSWEGHHA
jgi:hypothetical protein